MRALMSAAAWIACVAWVGVAIGVAAIRAARAIRAGRAREALGRARSPTALLFAAYLLVAALVTPVSEGESSSPLLWLAIAFPIVHAAGALAAAAEERPGLALRAGLAALFGGAMLAAAAMILATASPAFVPGWLR
ncbi:MAG: hypothetical protein R3B70_29885 [Polyangiaceae bacterium]